MLKGVPKILPPELLKVLCEMGHGDRICIGDGNLPCESLGKNAIVIRMDGHNVPEILDAILTVFPLDTYVEHPAIIMQIADRDIGKVEVPIWDEFNKIIKKHDERGEKSVGKIERFDFYDESKKCYCIIATGEKAIYANIILQKGIVF